MQPPERLEPPRLGQLMQMLALPLLQLLQPQPRPLQQLEVWQQHRGRTLLAIDRMLMGELMQPPERLESPRLGHLMQLLALLLLQ